MEEGAEVLILMNNPSRRIPNGGKEVPFRKRPELTFPFLSPAPRLLLKITLAGERKAEGRGAS